MRPAFRSRAPNRAGRAARRRDSLQEVRSYLVRTEPCAMRRINLCDASFVDHNLDGAETHVSDALADDFKPSRLARSLRLGVFSFCFHGERRPSHRADPHSSHVWLWIGSSWAAEQCRKAEAICRV